MNVIDRFEEKYVPEPNTGCFIWTGSLDWSGYGRIGFEGRNWKANRIAWLFAHGEPGELHVLHRCDNRLCVNPDHLFLGTNHENCIDKAKKGRIPNAKLSADKVRKIRTLRANRVPVTAIASEFGVDRGVIYQLLRGEVWAHVL